MKSTFDKLRQRYRYSLIILKQLVITDFKLRYKGSALGYLWTLLKPLALFAVLYVVFVQLLRFGTGVPHFPVYLLLGIVLWNYFVEVTTNGLSAIVGRGDLMRKLYFPRYVIVLAGSFSALINLVINLAVVGVFMVISGVELRPEALLAIPLIIELFVLALAISFLLSALYVRFRDVNYIWEVILQAGFYSTPIIYPLAMVTAISPLATKLMLLSPMAQIIQDIRWAVITPQTTTITDLYGTWYVWLIPIGITVFAGVAGAYYFRVKSHSFAEYV